MTRCCHETTAGPCANIPSFERPTYHFGQLLGAAEFIAQHDYLAEKLKLLTRRALGHGIVCGLETRIELRRPEDCSPSGPVQERWYAVVSPGLAIDCHGELLVVRNEIPVPLLAKLPPDQKDAVVDGGPVYVGLCFDTRWTCPTRPFPHGSGETCEAEEYAFVRDDVAVIVRSKWPEDGGCDECCDACDQPCLPLVRVNQVADAGSWTYQLDHTVRRYLGRNQLTTITGIGWNHGGTYTRDEADALLASGLPVRFSADVATATLKPGVVDVIVYQGGAPPAGYLYRKVVDLGLTDSEYTRELLIRFREDERLQRGDRVQIVIKGDFILDRCCRALDGNHIGGAVPSLTSDGNSNYSAPAGSDRCPSPPGRPGPWTSGNGTEGGTFESWFEVETSKPPITTEPAAESTVEA